jgi:large subunit ribosomal protein L9
MQVIFIQDVPGQAHAGEVLKVANGYARNYLIPMGLAALATPETLKHEQKIKTTGNEQRAQESQIMEELAQVLDNTKITVSARVTPTGRFYGAISGARIAAGLSSIIGRDIDRKIVDLIEPIREPGEHERVLRLSGDIQATILITAEAEE